jgi:hypothetical protein
MIKVRILDRCEFCDGEEYIVVCEDVDARGELIDRYRPCEMCQGSGYLAKWGGPRCSRADGQLCEARWQVPYPGGVHSSWRTRTAVVRLLEEPGGTWY